MPEILSKTSNRDAVRFFTFGFLILILSGCPNTPYSSEVPMGNHKLPIDEALTGQWYSNFGEAPDSLGQPYTQISKKSNSLLEFKLGAPGLNVSDESNVSADDLTTEVFITDVNGIAILNERKRTDKGNIFRFWRYRATDQFIQLWSVQDSLFEEDSDSVRQFDNAEALHRFASRQIHRKGFFSETFKLYVKPGVSAAEIFRMGIDDYRSESYEQAYPWLQASAELGDRDAQALMGHIHLLGRVSEADTAKAITYYELAAAQDNQFAQYALGRLLQHGYWENRKGENVFIQNDEKSILWLSRAARNNHEVASQTLMDIYLNRPSTEQNLGKALQYARKWASLATDSTTRKRRTNSAKIIDQEIQIRKGKVPEDVECKSFNMLFHKELDKKKYRVNLAELVERIEYPHEARTNGVEGKVAMFVQVNRLGHATLPVVLESVSPSIDKEAERVAQFTTITPQPTWNGLPVCGLFKFNIPFKLSEEPRLSRQPKRYSPKIDANPGNTALQKGIQSIFVTTRTSLVDANSRVMVMRNSGNQQVRFRMKCTRGRSYKWFTINLFPDEMTELGFAQGWPDNFRRGDKCTAYNGNEPVWSWEPRF